jgi:hemerythrin
MLLTQNELPMMEIASMNDSHLEELILINKLDIECKKNSLEEVSKLLEELYEQTVTHFSQEEELMQKGDYPEFQTHKAEHDRHLKEFRALRKYFDKNQDTRAISAYVEGNLGKWVIHHTETMDKPMASVLKEI